MTVAAAASQEDQQPPSFVDTSTDCAICLCPLVDDNDDDDSEADEVITLNCGHRWHLSCISSQIRHARPDPTRRLLFAGCRCAKCAAVCDHPKLKDLTRNIDGLREKVDAMIGEQLAVDCPDVWKRAVATSSGEERRQLMERGRASYAFYLCGSCQEPYFGGTVECADLMEEDDAAGAGAAAVAAAVGGERLCPNCTPSGPQLVCRDPVQHRGMHVWKCRYCCHPAQYVCYGTVHLCEGCHGRNDELVQNRRRRWQDNHQLNSRPTLEAKPCPGGGACPHPKLRGQDRHRNGSTADCEQVYHCGWCRSLPHHVHGYQQHLHHQLEPGSRNFIRNPSGEDGLAGWRQLNPQCIWNVEAAELPYGYDGSDGGATNFVSSFQWCVQAQQVPLHQYVLDPSSVRVEVAAKFMGRTDCPSIFRMEALVLDRYHRQIHKESTGTLHAPVDYWERASLVVEPRDGMHSVVMVVYGKDDRFWRGNFGSKVAECSVRVLGTEEELERVLRDEEEEQPPAASGGDERRGANGNQPHRALRQRQNRRRTGGADVRNNDENIRQRNLRARPAGGSQGAAAATERQSPQDWIRNNAFDIVVIPIALIVFGWMLSRD